MLLTGLDWPRLLSLASHELRTPAGVAAGYVRMLLAGRPHPPTDEQRRLLEAADRSAARVAELLADLSDVARLASGQTVLDSGPVRLHEAVATAVAAFVPREGSEIAVDVCPSPAPLVVSGDRARLVEAISAVLAAVGREAPDRATLLAVLSEDLDTNRPHASLVVGEASVLARMQAASLAWGPADLLRSGNGLDLVRAALAVDAAGGRIGSPAGGRTPVLRLMLPIAG